MNFLQLKQRLARRRNDNATSFVSLTGSRYADALNESQRQILRMPGLESLRRATLTFASVASTQQYALPVQGVARIDRIWETTNDFKLCFKPMGWLRESDPDPVTGTPWAWVPAGYQDVHTQPSNASSVFVDSTSASDTGTAYVEGITTGGYHQSKSVTMTGTTAVNISTAVTDWILITKFYLSTAAVGTVTLHEDASGGTELSKIAPGDVRAQFYSLFLYPTPSAVVTYFADILRTIPDMSNDTDEPLIPEDFHDLLLDKAEMKELRKADDPKRWEMLRGSVARGEADLKTFVINHPDWRPTWGDEPARHNRLGAQFPIDQVGRHF